jgi:hypothetical protein
LDCQKEAIMNTVSERIILEGALILALIRLAFVFPAVVSVGYVRTSFRTRERFRRRQRAMQGEQEAMPRARMPVDAEQAPDVSGQPLELMWRATPFSDRIMTTIITISLVIFSPFAGIFMYAGYLDVTTNTEHYSLLERGFLLGIIVYATALLLFLIVFLVRLLPWERGKPYGVIASNDGLWYYPRILKRRFLRWDEVSLLEVNIPKNERYQGYKLYSRASIARWLELPPSRWASLGVNKEEFEQRHQALLNLIAAQTGLLPRTFDKKLIEA